MSTKSTDTKILKERNTLVVAHVHLVNFVISRMISSIPANISRDDVMSMGCWGLIDAANKYDQSKGVLFKTYAITRIRGAIIDELRRQTLGGQTICRKARMIEKAIQELELGGKQAATNPEIAKHLGISEDKLFQLLDEVSRSFLISLDDGFSNPNAQADALLDTIQDPRSPDPLKLVEKSEIKKILAKQLDTIPKQEQTVLLLYYYEVLTFKEIGAILSVSESRVSQIHSKALMRLRSRLKHQFNDL